MKIKKRGKTKIWGTFLLAIIGILGFSVSINAYDKDDFLNNTWYGTNTSATVDFTNTVLQFYNGSVTFYLGWGIEDDTIVAYLMNGEKINFFSISEENGKLQLTGVVNNTELNINNEGVYTTKDDLPIKDLAIGDTAVTDTIEFTLNDIGFSEILEKNYASLDKYYEKIADDGMTFFCADIHVKNISTTEKDFKTYYSDYILKYNEYEFTTTGASTCYCYSSNQDNGYEFTGTTSRGFCPTLAPLTEMDIHVAIPCAKVVSEDENASLQLIVTLPNESTTEKFEYDLTDVLTNVHS